MDQERKKALAAAITVAVTNYIKTREEGLKAAAVRTAPSFAPASTVSFYGAYGRQEMMDMRRLLSLRMTRR